MAGDKGAPALHLSDVGCRCRRPACRMALAGDKPQRYNPLSPPLWIPAPYRGTGHAFDRRNDDWGAGLTSAGAVAFEGTLEALRSIIFVPIAHAGCRRHTKV